MVMEQAPSPQCIGRAFVKQYYTMLHEAPMHVHRFYINDSCFVHGRVDKPGETTTPVTGQQEIHKKILSLNFRDCHTKIRQVDSQASVGNAVVVQVTGELSNNGLPMRRFTQTFVLVPQSPKNYYVHNDIFRYQDWVFGDNDTDNEAPDDVDSEQENAEPTPPTVETPPTAMSYYDSPPPTQPQSASPLSNGTTHLEEPVEPVTPPKPVDVEPEPPAPVVEEPEPVMEPIYKPPTPVETAPEPEPEPVHPEPEIVSKVPGPVSWAAMLQQSSGSGPPHLQHQSQGPPPSMKPPQAMALKMDKPPASQDVNAPGQPQPQRTTRPPRDRGARERDSSRQGDNDDMGRRSRLPDSHQVFVGNLPHTMTEDDLKDFFEHYIGTTGKVVEMRINKKGGGTTVPNYGFVAFDSEKAVQKVLNNRGSFTLPDGHRLNVEEKKQRGDTGGRPGSGTRAGGRGGMSRGGMGGDVGGSWGRGGGPPSGRGGGEGRGGPMRRGGFGGPPRR